MAKSAPYSPLLNTTYNKWLTKRVLMDPIVGQTRHQRPVALDTCERLTSMPTQANPTKGNEAVNKRVPIQSSKATYANNTTAAGRALKEWCWNRLSEGWCWTKQRLYVVLIGGPTRPVWGLGTVESSLMLSQAFRTRLTSWVPSSCYGGSCYKYTSCLAKQCNTLRYLNNSTYNNLPH